ncbi:nucleotidyltransferase family protein [Gracilibacillus saliphilus]|uniref:nucleotidyltransferase family protein n=1 Tax=Gracilibacillus saliphilus TaxID=543890 RepID=UPI0013D56B44|nr:nucleotidyltransferase domain-containing protein [Gracilibacillus saliphilus]
MFGLLERDQQYIIAALKQHPEIEQAIIFGSRAVGNYKKGSDINLAIVGDHISQSTLLQLHDLLEESYPLPYFFDIVHYDQLENQQLREHIDEFGKAIYTSS